MDTIREELIKALEMFKEKYRISSGIPRLAIGYYSFDPIESADLNHTADVYYKRTSDSKIHIWKDLGILVEELEYLFKSMIKNHPIFYVREIIKESSIITKFDHTTMSYERFFIENENDFYKGKSEKYKITNETSNDPIFETLINFYGYKQK